jgi:hypothetical protein
LNALRIPFIRPIADKANAIPKLATRNNNKYLFGSNFRERKAIEE